MRSLLIITISLLFYACNYSANSNETIERNTSKAVKSLDLKPNIEIEKRDELTTNTETRIASITKNKNEKPKILCSANTNLDEVKVNKVDLKTLAPKNQVFLINPLKDTSIMTARGVQFHIPAYTFDAESEITLSIQEFFEKTEAYLQGLTTLTTDGGILESGGMFNLVAKDRSGEVELVEGGEIILELPKEVPAEMNVYYGQENENGDVLWELDELGTTLSPVFLLKKGRFKTKASQFFAEQYKMKKELMLALEGKEWKTHVSFDRKGNIIGYTKCNEDSDSVIAQKVACQRFFEIIGKANPTMFAYHMQKWDVEFLFECVDRKVYVEALNKELAKRTLNRALKGFEHRSEGKRRRYFSIGELGFINIDRDVPLPEMEALIDVKVLANNDAEVVKLVYQNRNIVIAPTKGKGFYIFNRIPLGTPVKVLSTYGTADKVFYAINAFNVEKKQPIIDLAYNACKKNELATKIENLCQ